MFQISLVNDHRINFHNHHSSCEVIFSYNLNNKVNETKNKIN